MTALARSISVSGLEWWSKGEQSTAWATATGSGLQELYEWNARYREKFGFIFIICASGGSADEILAELKRRYSNRPLFSYYIESGDVPPELISWTTFERTHSQEIEGGGKRLINAKSQQFADNYHQLTQRTSSTVTSVPAEDKRVKVLEEKVKEQEEKRRHEWREETKQMLENGDYFGMDVAASAVMTHIDDCASLEAP
ncbi:hypothetical protein K1719_031042 [Acacia pycnantha]|nr:hypothetical protein K1719_031042 [Acacia pycnantha]